MYSVRVLFHLSFWFFSEYRLIHFLIFVSDESPKLKHDERGLLSMSIADRDIRGSLFNLMFKANQNLDRLLPALNI